MKFLIILQSIQQFTRPLVDFVVTLAVTGFLIYVVWGGLMAYREFASGDPERGKQKAINIVIGIVVFTVLIVSKDSITQMITGTSIPSR